MNATMKTKTTILLACLACCARGDQNAEPVPPPPQLESVAQVPQPLPPEEFIARPATNASAMSVMSLAEGAGGPGPDLPGSTNALDLVITNLQASVIQRMATNWFRGSLRSGTAYVPLMGVQVPVPLYVQAGRVQQTLRANFQLDGTWTGCDLSDKPVAMLYRTFAADGTNVVFFPDITSDPLP